MTFEEWLGNQIDERNEIYAEIGQECYDNGYQQGRTDAERDFQNSEYWNDYLQKIISDAKADAIEEFCNEIDLDKPMHFTKEQTSWIKKYVILKRHDAIDELVKEFDKSIKSEIRREYWWTDVVVRMKKIAEQLKEG